MPPKNVSLLGLGAMGSVLASTFISHSYQTTVWNRTPSKAEPLVKRGAIFTPQVAECIAAADVVIICLLNNDVVIETLSAAGVLNSLAGKTIVNLTNTTPSQARETSKLITSHGAEYIDGGIMAIPVLIGTPNSFILYSGAEAAFNRVEADLAHLGKPRFVSAEDPGRASLYDIALLSGMYGAFSGALHALALVHSTGSSLTEFTDELLLPWMSAMVPQVSRLGGQVQSGEYLNDGSPLAMQEAGIANMVATSREAGVWEGMLAPTMKLISMRVAGGGGNEGLAGLVNEMGLDKHS